MTFSIAKIDDCRERRLRRLAAWSLTLTIVGYPMAGMIATVFNWDSTVTSFPFRIGILAFTAIVLVRSPTLVAWTSKCPWLLVFHSFYLIRLLWDLLIAGIPTADEALMTYGALVIPALAIAPIAEYFREPEAAKRLVIIGSVVCVLVFIAHLTDVSAERAQYERTFQLGFEALNPISLGHVATSTILACTTLLMQRQSMLFKIINSSVIAAALTCLILTASRGPVISLLASLFVLILYRGNRKALAFCAVGALVITLITINLGDDLRMLYRFGEIEDGRSSLERLAIQGNSFAQFLQSPVFGSSFLELEFLEYPHNIFIETAMALGVFGIGLLLFGLYRTCQAALDLMRQGDILVPLLFIQYFIGAQMSGAIYDSSALWVTVALLSAGASSHGKKLRLLTCRVSPGPAEA